MKKLFLILLFALPLYAGTPRHVVPSGGVASGNALTEGTGWTWKYAVHGNPTVQPGDTLYLHAGTYYTDESADSNKVTIDGTAGNPIIIRNWQNDRVTLQPYEHDVSGENDSMLSVHYYWTPFQLQGDYIGVWGLEIAMPDDPNNQLYGGGCITMGGSYGKLINCIIHDGIDLGVRDQQSVGTEVVGNLIYFNGRQTWRDKQDGYAGYVQTGDTSVQKVWRENLMFENWGQGIQFYGSGAVNITNFKVVGNVIWNNGQLRNDNDHRTYSLPNTVPAMGSRKFIYNFVFGSGEEVVQRRDTLMYNVSFYSSVGGVTSYNTVDIGYNGGGLTDSRVDSNFWINQAGITDGTILTADGTTQAIGNVITGVNSGFNAGTNTISASVFTERATDIIQRVNPYESNRAHITILNWQGNDTVKFLPTCLTNDSTYRLVWASDYYGAVADSGTWHTGDSIEVVMADLSYATPVSSRPDSVWGRQNDPVNTQPYFAVLVLMGGGTGGEGEPPARAATVKRLWIRK